MVAGKPKLVLVPAGEAEATEAADTAGPGAPPDFWAKRVPGRTFGEVTVYSPDVSILKSSRTRT